LQATKTALSGVQAGQAAAMASATGDPNATGVSLSLTTQKSKSQQHSESDTVSGSTLNAGNNLSVVATGKNRGDNRGDIVIAGSQLKAGGNTNLDAANDVLLSGAANTQKTTGRNSSSGGGVGVSIGAGKGAGISVFASVNAAKGSEKGNGTEWTETTTDSGKTVTINSGRDTVLNGAQVNGNRIIADVGHDLLISSQQDTSKYDSKQTSVAAGGSFTFGSMTGSGYIAASRDKMKSRFDSVAEQTGMFAGDGGFDITVGKHTQLDGAVIASTATPDKNHLDTGTLGFSDLHNEADYKVSHSGISLSGGGSFGDKFQGNMPGGMISAGGHSGHAEGTTQAAVAEGTITIRDRGNQKQNLANLSRDPAHANDSISPIFDKEKEQRRLQTVGLISDIGSQVADIARTQGELNALKAAQDKYGPVPADATEEQRQAYLAKLRDTPEYKKEQEKYGTGSDMQRGIQAATAALQGLAGGNLAGALAGASAPELANIIGHHAGIDDNTAAKAIAHAILGGVTAALQGNSAAAGAIGAGTGEVISSAIAKSLYPDVDPSKLTEDQKQTVSTLATLSAGMAGGIASGDVAGAAAGAGVGKNIAENNLVGGTESEQSKAAQTHGADVLSCNDAPGGEACKRGEAVNKAYAGALATGSVALLPGGAQAMWGLGAGANAGVSYLTDGTIDPTTAIIGGWVNVISAGNGVVGTVGWNATGGALGNWLEGKAPTSGALINGAGSAIGYGIGKGLSWGINSGANWLKDGWDPKFNPTLQKYTDIKGELGLSKEMTPSRIPGIAGDVSASFASEYEGKKIESYIPEVKK
ncbi:hemagglutinin repeat-containing protein, partial [Escherichia coli]|nr:hemagglutinin repeat-containing protein [Escherichia coli]